MSRRSEFPESAFKRSQIRRIALRTGHVRSISTWAFEKVRHNALSFLDELLKNTITYTEHARRTTISSADVKDGLRNMKNAGDLVPKIYGSPSKKRCETYEKYRSSRRKSGSRKSRKSRRSTSLVRKIKFYQAQHGCVHLARAPVARLVKNIAKNRKSDVKFSDSAMTLIIYILELYIEKRLKLAGLLSIHRKGKGNLSDKDMETVALFEKMFLA